MARERVRRPPAVARVLERVTSTVREHEMFAPGDLVLVSVSGGPDSVCLLYSLWHLRRLFRIRLAVFHFDHKLRPGSGEDADYVRRLAARLRSPFLLVEAVSSPAPGRSIEEWGHVERGRARTTVANDIGAARIATAHTLDDQAETVLMAVLQGGGIDRVSGIEPAAGALVRPMLEVTRADVEAFCRSLGLRPRLDPTNLDARFLRNAVRLQALPALERVVGRGVREPLARTADLLREDAHELDLQARAAWNTVAVTDAGGVALAASALRALPPAIAARVVSHAVFHAGCSPTRAHVRSLLDLAQGRPGRGVALSGGLKARRDRRYVRLTSPRSASGSDDDAAKGEGA